MKLDTYEILLIDPNVFISISYIRQRDRYITYVIGDIDFLSILAVFVTLFELK